MRFLLSLLVLCFAMNTFAAPYPYQSENDFKAELTGQIQMAQFDATIASTVASGSTFILGTLPAKAIITKTWIQVTNDDMATESLVSLGCKTAVDLMAATSIGTSVSPAIVTGAVTAPASFVQTVDGCTVSGTVTVANLTTGAFTAFVEYVFGK